MCVPVSRYVPPDQARAVGNVQASVSGSSASSTGSTPEVQPLKTLQLNKTPLRQVARPEPSFTVASYQPHCLQSVDSVCPPTPPSLQGYLVPRLTALLRRRSLTCCPTWAETSSQLRPARLPLLPTLPTLHIFRASRVRRSFPNMFDLIEGSHHHHPMHFLNIAFFFSKYDFHISLSVLFPPAVWLQHLRVIQTPTLPTLRHLETQQFPPI